jgi:hypothetical protein
MNIECACCHFYNNVWCEKKINKLSFFLSFFLLFRNLGTVEMEDQIAVTRKLVETYSFMDKTRTGIWGWSYGGFATLMTLEQDVAPDPVFSCGISGSIFATGIPLLRTAR